MTTRKIMAALLAAFLVGWCGWADAAPVELKDSAPAKQAAEWVRDKVAQGNERQAAIEKLAFDPATGEAELVVYIRCRQVSGHVYNPFSRKRVPIVAYDYSLKAAGTFNARKGRLNAVLDFGRGIKLDVKNVATILGKVVK
jgi:hypothetical protein